MIRYTLRRLSWLELPPPFAYGLRGATAHLKWLPVSVGYDCAVYFETGARLHDTDKGIYMQVWHRDPRGDLFSERLSKSFSSNEYEECLAYLGNALRLWYL